MKSNTLLRVLLTSTLALVLAGANCPDPEPEPPPPGGGGSQRDRMLDAYVEYLERCAFEESAFMAEVERAYFENLVPTHLFREYFAAFLDQLFESPHVQVDGAALESCITWLNSRPDCSDSTSDECENAFVGSQVEGGDCANEVECLPGHSCAGLSDTSCGVCTAPVGLGESCEEIGCLDGLVCLYPASGPATCVAPVGLGEACAETACAEGLYCDHGQAQAVCSPLAGLGESCESAPCDVDLDCDWSSSSPVCIQQPTSIRYQVGEACDRPEGCGEWARTGLRCDDPDNDGSGTCVQIQIAEEGEVCGISMGTMDPICRNGLVTTHYCDADVANGQLTGTCQRRPSVGEACTPVFNYCNGLEAYCDIASGQCAAILAEGQSCEGFQDNPSVCGLYASCDGESMTCRARNSFEFGDGPPVCE